MSDDAPRQLKLPKFEARPVKKITVKVTNAGDGLSEALKFEPRPLRIGEEVDILIRGRVTAINHKNTADEDEDVEIERVQTIKAAEVAFVDREDAEPLLKAANERMHEHRLNESLAQDAERGQARMDAQDDDPTKPKPEWGPGSDNPDA